jgi:hypothetical protein
VLAIGEYVDRLHHIDLTGAASLREALLIFDAALEPQRAAVVNAMRRDLRTRKMPPDLIGGRNGGSSS